MRVRPLFAAAFGMALIAVSAWIVTLWMRTDASFAESEESLTTARDEPVSRPEAATAEDSERAVLEPELDAPVAASFELLPRPAGLISAGIVVDDAGAAVPGAQVLVYPAPIASEDPAPASRREMPLSSATTDSAGRYTIPGDALEPRISLIASKHGFDSIEELADSGASGAVVRLRRRGSLAGRILLNDPGDRSRLKVLLADEKLDLHRLLFDRDKNLMTVLDDQGNFSLRGIPAGTYSVLVFERSSLSSLGLIENIEVRPAEVARDVRLDPLDLRDLHAPVELYIQDQLGRLVPNGQVYLLGRGLSAPRTSQIISFESGRIAFPAGIGRCTVRIEAEEFLSLEISCATGTQTAVLQRAPHVEFRLPESIPVPVHPQSLVVQIVPAGIEAPTFEDRQTIGFCSTRTTDAYMKRLGTLGLRAWVQHLVSEDQGFLSQELVFDPSPVIEIFAEPAEQSITLPIDPRQVEIALAALRAQR